MEKNKRKLTKLWNQCKELAKKQKYVSKELYDEIIKVYGKHYEDIELLKDNDSIIDTIDYGTDNITFKRFDDLMQNPKLIFEKEGGRNSSHT